MQIVLLRYMAGIQICVVVYFDVACTVKCAFCGVLHVNLLKGRTAELLKIIAVEILEFFV
jgi:hypothetical protein